jgi:type IV pilus assembly protein PilP
LFCLSLLLLVSGCGGGNPPPVTGKKAAAEAEGKKTVPPKPSTPAAPVQEKKAEAEYAYVPAGKPDPFKPFIQLSTMREVRNVPLTPLQKYEISQLKLVAIISTQHGNVGLVEDSAGKGYFLKPGTEIGKNDGKVTRILKDRVIVEEAFQDVLGQPKVNEVLLVLHKAEEGGGS